MDTGIIPPLRLVAGLGNPGRDYESTRHNVGFMILDRLAAETGSSFEAASRWRAHVAPWSSPAGNGWLCKPMDFMNRSGGPVRAIADFYKIEPAEMLVIYDEAALPLGKLRMRRGGTSGGHNGIQSVMDHLGTADVPRLRIGIGAAGVPGAMTGHVLGRFSRDETAALDEALSRAVDAVKCVASDGIETAMNQFN